jgi:hypothetical protein
MRIEELIELHSLLTKWINEPNWNKQSQAWATIVETRRQVLIDLKRFGVSAGALA